MQGRPEVIIVALAAIASAWSTAPARAQVPVPWPTYMYNRAHTGFNPLEATLGTGNVGTLVNIWNASVGDFTFFTGTSSFSESGGVLFGPAAGDFRSFEAIRASDGTVLWQVPLVPTGKTIGVTPATVAGSTVYVGVNGQPPGELFAIGTLHGHVKFAVPSVYGVSDSASVLSPPTVAGGLVYFGDDRGALTAVNATSGAFVWAANGVDSAPCFNCFVAGAPSYAVDSVLGATVYVGAGFEDSTHFIGNFSAYDAATGAPRWRTAMGPVRTTAAVAGHTVFVNSDDGKLYALDASTGAVRWSFTLPGGVAFGSPAVAGGVVYDIDDSSNLFALGELHGHVRWEAAGMVDSEKTPVVANGVVYADGNTQLRAFDAATGALLFAKGFSCVPFVGPPTVVNGAVYVVSTNSCGGPNDLSAFALP